MNTPSHHCFVLNSRRPALLAGVITVTLLFLPNIPVSIAENYDTADSQYILPPTIFFQDAGVNPYHIDFRLPDGFDPLNHPGYYPDEAIILDITLDAESYQEALAQDEEIWGSLGSNQLYAFNGTRIVGAVQFDSCEFSCIRDTDGHGTLVMSAAAGERAGSCPQCRIVMLRGVDTKSEWAFERPWIDAKSFSVASFFGAGPQVDYTSAQSHQWTQTGRLWIAANGNGVITGGPTSHLAKYQGPPWVFNVGNYPLDHRNTRSFDVVAQSPKDVARHDRISEYRTGTGTSTAAPDAAGHAMMLLWEARRIFTDNEGWRDGALTHASDPSVIPEKGPLSDGKLTGNELKDLLRATAREPPPSPGLTQPNTPQGPYSYWEQGFGLVDHKARELASAVLRGEAEPPEKPWEWWWHDVDQYIRDRWGGWVQFCLSTTTHPDTWYGCLLNNQPDLTDLPPTPPEDNLPS